MVNLAIYSLFWGVAQAAPPPEQLLQLAHIYQAEAQSSYHEALLAYMIDMERCFNEGCDTTQIKMDDHLFQNWSQRAIDSYQKLISEYPEDPNTTEALFEIGQLFLDRGDKESARSVFTEIVHRFPQSQQAVEAWGYLADDWFERSELVYAMRAYQKATETQNHPYQAQMLYKLAICYQGISERELAIELFKKLALLHAPIDPIAHQDGILHDPTDWVDHDDVMDRLLHLYADSDQLNQGLAWIQQNLPKEDIQFLLLYLASDYLYHDQYQQALWINQRMLANDPHDIRAPDYQQQLILLYDRLHQPEQKIRAYQALLQNYGPQSSWARAHSDDLFALHHAAYIIQTTRPPPKI